MISKKLQLGPLEQEVMEYFLAKKKATCRDVLETLNDRRDNPMAYTTLMTILDRLNHQEYLGRLKKGKSYVYFPIKSREETIKEFAHSMIQTLTNTFGSEAKLVIRKELESEI